MNTWGDSLVVNSHGCHWVRAGQLLAAGLSHLACCASRALGCGAWQHLTLTQQDRLRQGS